MLKKIVLITACCGLAVQLSGCSLFSSEKNSNSEVTADAGVTDLEKIDGEEAANADVNAPTTQPEKQMDQKVDEALGESPAPVNNKEAPVSQDQENSNKEAEQVTAENPFAENVAAETADKKGSESIVEGKPVESKLGPAEEEVQSANSQVAVNSETEKKEPVPVTAPAPTSEVEKIANAPWMEGKTLLNTVYVVRPGDSLSRISQLIYGSNKTAELKKVNKIFKTRASVKPGDQIYYNSPHRPEDSAKMMTYYEDNGLDPEIYVVQPGDDLVKVSKKLLGFKAAWKEIWATNSVDSKETLEEGTELHYWKSKERVTPVSNKAEFADNAGPQPGKVKAAPALAAKINEMPQIPSQKENVSEALPPSPPPMPEAKSTVNQIAANPPMPPPPATGRNGEVPPPPPMPESEPPSEQMVPPPPPPPPAQNISKKKSPVEDEAAGNDTTLALGVVGIATAGLALLIVMRKKKQREADMLQNMDTNHAT